MSPASYATYAKIKGKHAVDKSSHYLELALQYFERSEQANNPQIRGKLRKLAQEYPDKALQMLAARWRAQALTDRAFLPLDARRLAAAL